jgi:sortase (surface protein transpeptidase)
LVVLLAGVFRGHSTADVKAAVNKITGNPISQLDQQSYDESPVSDAAVESYTVPVESPRYLRIPKLDMNIRVKQLSGSDSIPAPHNIFDAGWYENSARPGTSGTALITGHIAGSSKEGAFFRLANLSAGDPIEVQLGSGEVVNYKVVKTMFYDRDKIKLPLALTAAVPGKAALNLLTFTNRYDVSTQKFEQRLIVYAVQQ